MHSQIILSDQTIAKLELFRSLLEKWNSKINLVSRSDMRNLWDRHILDSARLLRHIKDYNIKVIDLGSGAGFPGLILSYCGIAEVLLIESDSRKCAFLQEASLISEKKIFVINERIEFVKDQKCDILTSRSLASLSSLLEYSEFFTISNKLLLHKGKSIDAEILEAKKFFNFNYKIYPSNFAEGSCILEIGNVSREKIG